jgi:hypothetical protein
MAAMDRQRPEMRWRPDVDDQKQQQRARIDMTGHRRPAEQRWRRAGGAADHDVLRCRPFEEQV